MATPRRTQDQGSVARSPDTRASWDAISDVYQARLGWPSDRLAWGIRCPFEDELRLLGDVSGKRVLVLGCGGGQDIVALVKMGAKQFTGVDISDRQLSHARDLLQRHGVMARLLRRSAEDLSVIDHDTIDIAVSVHALNYVERADLCFAETNRVLVPGGLFAFSVQHPANASTTDDPPYGFEKPYFQTESEWKWNGLCNDEVAFRSYYRTAGDWFELLTAAGFAVERLLEPRPVDDPTGGATGWAAKNDCEKYATVPGTLIFVARKPGKK